MGYYTRHELEIIDGSNDLISELRKECDEARYALEDDGSPEESSKWYNHDTDLKRFSQNHPEALFLLRGEGEDSGDIWREYYKNGKVQVCKAKLVFPDFNADLLS